MTLFQLLTPSEETSQTLIRKYNLCYFRNDTEPQIETHYCISAAKEAQKGI